MRSNSSRRRTILPQMQCTVPPRFERIFPKFAIQRRCHAGIQIRFYRNIYAYYGVLAILMGLSCIVSSVSITEAMWSDIEQTVIEAGTTMPYTLDEFKSYAIMSGALLLISGLSAFVGYYLAKHRMEFNLTLVAFVIATGTCFIGIITLLIGLYMTYRVYKCQPCFKS